MKSLIDSRIQRISAALPTLVSRLFHNGYVFEYPDEILPGVELNVGESIARIEKEIGPVPYAVGQFWREIGSVDLCGQHLFWSGCDCPDPLVVFTASHAIDELDDFLDDYEERMRCELPYKIPISADLYLKSHYSGGMWYNVECPATADDPLLMDERHEFTFLDYIELALKYGGFTNLENNDQQKWPVEMLAAGLFDTEE